MERSASPGEWTTREVLAHLLDAGGQRDPVEFLKKFSERDLPLADITAGQTDVTPERRTMTLTQFVTALDGQRRQVFAYLESLPDKDLQRKARIPFFKRFMGTDEVPMHVYAGALFATHWNDHAGQLAKIRKAAGLPEAK